MPVNTSRLKAIRPWLAAARYAWLCAAIILVALFVSLRPHTTEPVIRLTGLVLQLLGIGTVMWGISETRALFGHPSFSQKTKDWLHRFPLLRRNIELVIDGSIQAVASISGRAYGIHGAGENPDTESRLDALEKNITSIHERISQTQKEMEEEFRKTSESLKHENQLRQAEDSSIREKLEATGTGGVHISAIGALWLFVGVTLSTAAAAEIAAVLK